MSSIALVLTACFAVAGCSSDGNARKMLDATSEVYVLLSPTALLGGGPKSPNEVTTTRAKFADSIVFKYRDHQVESATRKVIVVYTAPPLIPDGAAFLTTTPNQALELAMKDATAEGVLVNPESTASSGLIAEALAGLTARKPIQQAISIKMP